MIMPAHTYIYTQDLTLGAEVFESALAEILPKGECYSLNIQSTRPQRVQFVHTEAKFSNLLFILEREFVHLYQILTRKRNNGGCALSFADAFGCGCWQGRAFFFAKLWCSVRVGAQPLLDASISKQFAWYAFTADCTSCIYAHSDPSFFCSRSYIP